MYGVLSISLTTYCPVWTKYELPQTRVTLRYLELSGQGCLTGRNNCLINGQVEHRFELQLTHQLKLYHTMVVPPPISLLQNPDSHALLDPTVVDF